MPKVFVSYAIGDHDAAATIISAVGATGLDVTSPDSIPPGTDLREEVRRLLDAAQCVIVLWSNAAVQSQWLQEEIGYAIQAWSSDRLVVATLDDTPLPIGLRDLSHIPIRSNNGSGAKELIDRVKVIVDYQIAVEEKHQCTEKERAAERQSADFRFGAKRHAEEKRRNSWLFETTRPPLKRIDGWFLSTFLDWAAIPAAEAEAERRASTMTPQSYRVAEEDVKALREAYSNGGYGGTVADHLCARYDGMESQYRLTRILKLHDQMKKLASEPGYIQFFYEAADEFAALERKVAIFLRRSDISLALAERLGKMDEEICEEVMRERRNKFAEDSRDLFGDLALFLARAVQRSESSEKDIGNRLREIGFAVSQPMNLPRFPIEILTLLAGATLFAVLILAGGALWYLFEPKPLLRGSSEYKSLLVILGVLTIGALIGMTGAVVWISWFSRRLRRAPYTLLQVPASSSGKAQMFISYSQKDSKLVDNLVRLIEQMGYPVWIDRESTGAQRFASKIVPAIRTSKLVGLMCSQNAFTSDHVVREVYVAGDFKKPFVAFLLDTTELPDEVVYFVSGFPRIPLVDIADSDKLRLAIERVFMGTA
jgi:hypothetical protein